MKSVREGAARLSTFFEAHGKLAQATPEASASRPKDLANGCHGYVACQFVPAIPIMG
jgi:hypothetical protein